MLTLKTFEGTARLFFASENGTRSSNHEVAFAEGTLTIGALTPEEATYILSVLGGPVLHAVSAPVPEPATAKEEPARRAKKAAPATPAEAPKAESKPAESTPAPAAEKPAAPVPEEKPAAPPSPFAGLPETGRTSSTAPNVANGVSKETNGHANGHAAPAAEPPKQTGWDLAGDGKGDDAEDRLNLDGDLPEEITTAKRLKDIVVYLQDHGCQSQELIVKACEKIKDRVPVLTRIPNIQERVSIAFEVLQTH